MPLVRISAPEALSRLNAKAFTELFHRALRDKDSSVQKAAVHGLLKAREPRYAEEVAVLLDHRLESVRRVAATGLHAWGWPRGRPARPPMRPAHPAAASPGRSPQQRESDESGSGERSWDEQDPGMRRREAGAIHSGRITPACEDLIPCPAPVHWGSQAPSRGRPPAVRLRHRATP